MSVLTDPSTYPISAAAARQLDRALFGHGSIPAVPREFAVYQVREPLGVVEPRREPGGWRIIRLVLEVLWAEDKTDPTGYLALIGGRGPQG